MDNFAIVFPGQGSQSLGMLKDLAQNHLEVQETFQEASEVLGYDLWALVQDGPLEDLNETFRTQPALLAASVAIWRVWQAQATQKPQVIAGHSLGEYSALVCAGVIEFKQAIALVALRGELMQQAVPAGIGAMAAIIGLDDDIIARACDKSAQDQVVSPVNFNSPGQVVIAGHAQAVERAGEQCKADGAKRVLPLPVSVPSHCALMKPAADELAVALEKITFNTPEISVINNVDVSCETDPNAIKDALIRQLYNPVRWTQSVEKMHQQGVTHLFEFGPGKVLTGLTKRIEKSLTANAVNDSESIKLALNC